MKKSIAIILFSILSILESCQIESRVSKDSNIGKLIDIGHFVLNKSVKENIYFFISKDFAESFNNFNLLSKSKLNIGLNSQNSTNRGNNITVISPKFPVYLLINIIGFLFYVFGGTISLFVILKNEFENKIDKVAWVITIIFAPIIGIFLFIFLGRKQIKARNIESD